jgi:hypothetical protein
MARADDDRPEGHTLDSDDRALIAKLRALPADGEEPDWRALEAQIRAQVAPLAMPSPWWRNWRWLVPIGALATTAAIVLVLASRPHGSADIATSVRGARPDASVTAEPTPTSTPAQTDDDAARAPALWLDGEAVDLEEIDDDQLAGLDPLAYAADDDLDTHEGHEDLEMRDGTQTAPASSDPVETIGGMLPMSDDRWIDALDDDEADRLEQFLARKRT